MADSGVKRSALDALVWPASRLGEACERLAQQMGLRSPASEVPSLPSGFSPQSAEDLHPFIVNASRRLGLEAELVSTPYPRVDQLLAGAAPALLSVDRGGELGLLVLCGGSRSALRVIAPDLSVRKVPVDAVRSALCSELEARFGGPVDRVLEEAGVPRRRRARAHRAILREQLSPARIGGCWLLRNPPGASFLRQIRQRGLSWSLFVLIGAHAVQYLLFLVSWWLIGRGALQGRLDQNWLLAWALLLLTLIPLQALVTWKQGILAIGVGGLMKRRLLNGALRLEPEEIRHQGAGQLLGRVIESEAFEALTLSGGFMGLVAIVELCVASAVLALGEAGLSHALLLVAWVILSLMMSWRYLRQRRRWTQARLTMTHDLVESMVGHRTRLAQQPRERWHDGEDQAVEHYLAQSAAMDGTAVALNALVSRGWLWLGLAALVPAFVTGDASTAGLAIGLGGVLLAQRALLKLSSAVTNLSGAAIAWNAVSPLFHAAARDRHQDGAPPEASALGLERAGRDEPLIEAQEIIFQHKGRPEPTLKGCSLTINHGERVLLEGPSGGGKSTLASLLVGLRKPDAGLMLLGGLDRHTIGAEGWRQHVVAAPQFHENHVFTETFAFNLLMGRRWPPYAEDVEEAEGLCRELGLGDLIDRMPAGLLQIVGETGWQLSHGERSRLFLARAMLQGADFVVLDESFAALDPKSLHRALKCVLERAPTLLVIAHP